MIMLVVMLKLTAKVDVANAVATVTIKTTGVPRAMVTVGYGVAMVIALNLIRCNQHITKQTTQPNLNR